MPSSSSRYQQYLRRHFIIMAFNVINLNLATAIVKLAVLHISASVTTAIEIVSLVITVFSWIAFEFVSEGLFKNIYRVKSIMIIVSISLEIVTGTGLLAAHVMGTILIEISKFTFCTFSPVPYFFYTWCTSVPAARKLSSKLTSARFNLFFI